MTIPARFKTSYAYPYALVRRGGDTPGKRISTRMAFITHAVNEDGTLLFFKGYIGNKEMGAWTKHPRKIAEADIVKSWRSLPSMVTIRKARKALPIAPPYARLVPRAITQQGEANGDAMDKHQKRFLSRRLCGWCEVRLDQGACLSSAEKCPEA